MLRAAVQYGCRPHPVLAADNGLRAMEWVVPGQGQHDKHLETTFVSPENIFFRSKTASICFSFIHYVLFVLYFVLCMQKETKMCV
jgi:hypothetical protein